jgi:hypothetical protein
VDRVAEDVAELANPDDLIDETTRTGEEEQEMQETVAHPKPA